MYIQYIHNICCLPQNINYSDLCNIFLSFISKHCEINKDSHTPLIVIEAAFSYYLHKNYPLYKKTNDDIAREYIGRLCFDNQFVITPGKTFYCSNIDTRCVLGIMLTSFY